MGQSTASMSEISTVTQDRKKLKLILCSTASEPVKSNLYHTVAQVLSVSTKGIRFNRAVAMETLHALHAVENDEEALETFLKEREQRAIAIKEHAQKLTRWKEHINSVNQAQGYDALTRRQEMYVNCCFILFYSWYSRVTSSMTERLVQLGYTREEIRLVPSNEFHSLLKQPRDLTPFSTLRFTITKAYPDESKHLSLGSCVTQAHRGFGGKQVVLHP